MRPVRDDDAAKIESAENRLEAADRALLDAIDALNAQPDIPSDLLGDNGVSARRYLSAIAESRALDGKERELNSGLKLNDNVMPLEALLPLESRADAKTTVPTGVDLTTASIAGRVFKQNDAGFLGVQMPTVARGTANYPYLASTGTTAEIVAEGDTHDAAAATITPNEVNPVRMTSAYLYGREARARIKQSLESTLREDLRQVLGDKLDDELINGDGATPTRPKGILGRITSLENAAGKTGATADDAAFQWTNYRYSVYQFLDGQYSRNERDIRVLMGLDTYKHARTVWNSTSHHSLDGVQSITAAGAAVQPSARIPAASAATNAAGKKQAAIWATQPGNVILPIWQGIEFIVDPYSTASAGQVRLTAGNALWLGIPQQRRE